VANVVVSVDSADSENVRALSDWLGRTTPSVEPSDGG
jgi:hypothetical protein